MSSSTRARRRRWAEAHRDGAVWCISSGCAAPRTDPGLLSGCGARCGRPNGRPSCREWKGSEPGFGADSVIDPEAGVSATLDADEGWQVVQSHRRRHASFLLCRQHPSHALRDTSLPWRAGVSIVCLPLTEERHVVSPPVASIVVDLGTTCVSASALGSHHLFRPQVALSRAPMLVALSCRHHESPSHLVETEAPPAL